MGRMLMQATVILVVAGAVGAYFAYTRPPRLNTSGQTISPLPPFPSSPQAAVEPKAAPKSTTDTPAPEHGKTGIAPAVPAEPPKKVDPPRPAPASGEPAKSVDGRLISIDRAKKLFDEQALNGQSVIFVDAREFWHYTDAHIPGAMHIDKKYFDGAAPKKVLKYLPGNAVVVYCMGADCSDSEAVATRLEALHLNIGPIFIIKDGLPGWQAAGYPVDKGGEVGFD
jgi:rhodanese-related sulfurtransferase